MEPRPDRCASRSPCRPQNGLRKDSRRRGRGVPDTRAARGRTGSRFAGGPKPRSLLVSLLARARLAGLGRAPARRGVGRSATRQRGACAAGVRLGVAEGRARGRAGRRSGYRLRLGLARCGRVRGAAGDCEDGHRGSGRHEEALASLDDGSWRSGAAQRSPGSTTTRRCPSGIGSMTCASAAVEDRAESVLALGRTLDLAELERLVDGASPPRAAARPADARALPRRAAGRGARRLRRDPAGPRRARPRARPPSCGRCRARFYVRTRRSTSSRSRCGERRHLPAPATSFVGRRAEVDAVTTLLRGDSSTRDAHGPGRSRQDARRAPGGTRARRRVRRRCLVRRPRAARRSRTRSPAIAQALGLRRGDAGGRAARTASSCCSWTTSSSCSKPPRRWASCCRRRRVCVCSTTSRARLRLYGEHELQLPPLPAADAEELFLGRARATGRALPPGAARHGDLPAPRRAATRDRARRRPRTAELTSDGVAVISGRQARSSRPRVPATCPSGSEPCERRSAGATISSTRTDGACSPSWARSPAASHATPFGRCAARRRGRAARRPRRGAASSAARDDGRYRMLQTIREYAVERLAERRRRGRGAPSATPSTSVELGEAARRHAIRVTRVDEAYATFEREHDNFRAALAFDGRGSARPSSRYRLAAAVAHFWLVRGYLAEGRAWLEGTLRLDRRPRSPAAPSRRGACASSRRSSGGRASFDIAGARAETCAPAARRRASTRTSAIGC